MVDFWIDISYNSMEGLGDQLLINESWFNLELQIIIIMDGKDKSTGNVMVVCRARPLNNKEIDKGAKCCLEFNKDKKNIAINMASETSSAFG